MDHTAALTAIIALIKQKTGKTVVLGGQSTTQPSYPFCSYSIPSPYLPQRTDHEGGQMHEIVEFVVSFTWHSQSNTEALQLAQQTVHAFKTMAGRQTLSESGLSLVRIDGMTNRDTFLTIETERRYGFDMRLRTRVSVADDFETIESVGVGDVTITE
ncbi:hypothetical protein [Exiguobacterium sp. s5]|uniref:phage neck terminator protein n=1 Tax=Exiguobacterium sp. s5 TaxID=2751239 RepID=UPI001BE87922|nr:hypothetical protein [Exiguobacterium sp. s5]